VFVRLCICACVIHHDEYPTNYKKKCIKNFPKKKKNILTCDMTNMPLIQEIRRMLVITNVMFTYVMTNILRISCIRSLFVITLVRFVMSESIRRLLRITSRLTHSLCPNILPWTSQFVMSESIRRLLGITSRRTHSLCHIHDDILVMSHSL